MPPFVVDLFAGPTPYGFCGCAVAFCFDGAFLGDILEIISRIQCKRWVADKVGPERWRSRLLTQARKCSTATSSAEFFVSDNTHRIRKGMRCQGFVRRRRTKGTHAALPDNKENFGPAAQWLMDDVCAIYLAMMEHWSETAVWC